MELGRNTSPMTEKASGSYSEMETALGIEQPGENDVMFGRGGNTNYHIGNNRFRSMVIERYKCRYDGAKSRSEKSSIAKEAVRFWRNGQNPPGRFLSRTGPTGTLWYEVSNDVACKKAVKVLGEKKTRPQREQLPPWENQLSFQLRDIQEAQSTAAAIQPEPQQRHGDGALNLDPKANSFAEETELLRERIGQQTMPVLQDPQAAVRPDIRDVPSAAFLTRVFDQQDLRSGDSCSNDTNESLGSDNSS